MTTAFRGAVLLMVSLVFAAWTLAAAASADDTSSHPTTKSFHAQEGQAPPPPMIRGQNGDDRTRDIESQPGAKPSPPEVGVTEVPVDKSYRPSEEPSADARQYKPDETPQPGQHPRLGIWVMPSTKCYLGQEEEGLEVMEIDPTGPAGQAGVHNSTREGPGPAGSALLAGLSGPLSLLLVPLLERAGAFGHDGDLVVGVNDRRIRSRAELEDELSKLKPGDTTYLTVIRPLPGHAHQTMKIAVKVGELNQFAQAPPAPRYDVGGAEEPAY